MFLDRRFGTAEAPLVPTHCFRPMANSSAPAMYSTTAEMSQPRNSRTNSEITLRIPRRNSSFSVETAKSPRNLDRLREITPTIRHGYRHLTLAGSVALPESVVVWSGWPKDPVHVQAPSISCGDRPGMRTLALQVRGFLSRSGRDDAGASCRGGPVHDHA